MQRLFISINCNDEIKKQLLSVQEQMKSKSERGNFSRHENFHLTLAFLGETPTELIEPICSCLNEIQKPPVTPFSLTFSRTGFIKRGGKELWWIEADQNNSSLTILNNLRYRITSGLSARKISFDNKAFKPHITLGREIIHDLPIIIPKQEIVFPVNRVSLMKSEHINKVLVYTEVYGAELNG